MKTRSSKTSKPRYFPKHYAPARAAALQSSKKSAQVTAKLSLATEKAAQATKKTARQISTRVSKAAANLTKRANQTFKPKSSSRAKSSTARQTSRRTSTNRFTWREVTLLSLIGTAASVIIATFILGDVLDPVKRSHNELERLANAYYIEYYYPHSLGKYLDQPETVLKDYVHQGLPVVRLRQLLLYDNGKHSDSIDIFSNDVYSCDTNKTYVRYYPVEPYGPRDYTLKLDTSSCEIVGSLD